MQPYYESIKRKIINDCNFNDDETETLCELLYRQRISREIEARKVYFHDYLVPAIMVNYDDGRLVDDETRSEILAWASTVEPMLALRHLRGLIHMIRWVGIKSDGYLILETHHKPGRHSIRLDHLDNLDEILRDITMKLVSDDGRLEHHFRRRVHTYARQVKESLFGDDDQPNIEIVD